MTSFIQSTLKKETWVAHLVVLFTTSWLTEQNICQHSSQTPSHHTPFTVLGFYPRLDSFGWCIKSHPADVHCNEHIPADQSQVQGWVCRSNKIIGLWFHSWLSVTGRSFQCSPACDLKTRCCWGCCCHLTVYFFNFLHDSSLSEWCGVIGICVQSTEAEDSLLRISECTSRSSALLDLLLPQNPWLPVITQANNKKNKFKFNKTFW